MKNIERLSEDLLFKSRWILAPFYGVLVVCIGLLLLKFMQEFFSMLPRLLELDVKHLILQILLLVDLTLLANLMLIIVFSGYETFVSKIDTKGNEDRPNWMGKVDFSQLKIKLFGSIVAISGIELLKAFMLIDQYTNQHMAWLVGIHLTFVISGLLFTYMDKVSTEAKKMEYEVERIHLENLRQHKADARNNQEH